jgi:2-keto-4-pentenoate hydratase
MRTTLILDDSIYQRAKVSAAQRGMTVASVVEEALQLLLAQPSESGPNLGPMPVDDTMSWVHPGIDLNDTSALREVMDADRDIDVLR